MLNETSRQHDFPGLSGKSYLNTAAEGVPPLAVGEALAAYFRDKQLGMDGRDRHFAQWQAARELTAAFYGLTADEIGICSCTSEAFNLAAAALRLREGDEIIINDLDFPAGATPWLQADNPATVKLWRSRDGALRVEDLIPLLSPKTRLVTTSLVSFYNGFLIPLPEVVEAVRQHSAALLALDVTQALGRIPLQLSGVDLIVSSTHKWILASHGGGLVGVPRERAEAWNVPAGGWFNLQDAFGAGRFEEAVSQAGAAGFMVGMPNFPAIYAIRAGLDYLRGIGVETINEAAKPLVLACRDGLLKLPVEMLTPTDESNLAGILAFRHSRAAEIHDQLQSQNIHIMHQAGRMRVSLHGYNTMADVDRLLRELKGILG